MILTAIAKIMFCLTILNVFLDNLIAEAIRLGSSFIITTSAASIAASLPKPPMAIPTSARAKTGASFIPSPTKATLFLGEDAFNNSSKRSTLPSGKSSA